MDVTKFSNDSRCNGYWIDDDWKLWDILLSASELPGEYSGLNMSELVSEELVDFNIQDKLYCLTTDNASSNRTLGRELEKIIQFDADERMLGCLEHVINLAAKAGLKALTFSKRLKV